MNNCGVFQIIDLKYGLNYGLFYTFSNQRFENTSIIHYSSIIIQYSLIPLGEAVRSRSRREGYRPICQGRCDLTPPPGTIENASCIDRCGGMRSCRPTADRKYPHRSRRFAPLWIFLFIRHGCAAFDSVFQFEELKNTVIFHFPFSIFNSI